MQAVPVSQVVAPSTIASPSRSDDGGFGFSDFLDIINPLQHIPIVGAVYREVTGDEIGPVAQLIGGGLYGLGLLGGGWLSLASTAANVALEQATGDDIAGHALDFLLGEDGGADETGAAEEAGDTETPAKPPAPSAVVVRSTQLTGNETGLFATPKDGEAAVEDAATLAAAAGQAGLSPELSGVLVGLQGEDAAIAPLAESPGSRDERHRDGRRTIAPGIEGFSLADAEVQRARGVSGARMAAAALN